MIRKTVTKNNVGLRLDVYVSKIVPSISRSSVQKLLKNEAVQVNKQFERPSYHLRLGDKVAVDFDPNDARDIPDIDLEVLYEDDDCVVINKPEGLLTHSKGSFNPEATVATFISSRLQGLEGERAGIVHRLDRATSGVIIAAKHSKALAWLQKQFSQRRVKKTYYAIVSGHIDPEEAVIDMPIERHPRTPKTFRTSLSGKPATTYYKVVEKSASYDLVELKPTTGRTHQLRVHLKQLGHPIVGDVLYDGEPAERLFLHATHLELTLPNRQRQHFDVPLPKSFRSKLESDAKNTSTPKNKSVS